MKKIISALLCLFLALTSIPMVSIAQTYSGTTAIDISAELTDKEKLLIENDELEAGIYFNEKSHAFFEDVLDRSSVLSINNESFLEINILENVFEPQEGSDTLYSFINNSHLIISINDLFKDTENQDGDLYIVDSINESTYLAVFDAGKAADLNEEELYHYIIEIINDLKETHSADFDRVENVADGDGDDQSVLGTLPDENVQGEDIEDVTDDNEDASNVIETIPNENVQDENIEDKIDDNADVSNNLDATPDENIDDDEIQSAERIKIDSAGNDLWVSVDSNIISKIISSVFSSDFENKVNSICVSNASIDMMVSIIENLYDSQYSLYNGKIKITESLILNSASDSLEDNEKYISLGLDEEGNLLSAKVSDYINKENGLLKLMFSNYATVIVSYDELLENGIEINENKDLMLLYQNNKLVIAVNTEKIQSIIDIGNNTFDAVINTFLDSHKINLVQTIGSAVGWPVVYSGPGKSGYAAVGSLDPFDEYETIYKELGFQYIEYEIDGTSTKKRGYIDQFGGGSGTIPDKYKTGVGAKIKSGGTVYSGPSSSYATVGSVSTNESVTLLSKTSENSYYYFEYPSSTGTKRGYMSSSSISITSNTGIGVTLKDITVYDDYVVNSGSLNKNEFFVITGYNDNYYKIEYNVTTTVGRKTGYVFKPDVQSLNSNVSIPKVANSSAIHAVPKQSTSVYGGPSSYIYANIGSVDETDTVGVLGKEGSYYYIQYSTSSGSKRGYVEMSALNSFSGSGSIKSTGVESAAAYADAPKIACTVYSCPDVNSATVGSIGAYEGITVFPSINDNGFTFVEYSTSANTKRGFISTSLIKGYNEGVKGKAATDLTIYYSTYNSLSLGSIYGGEYVIILGKIDDYYYIEYNSPSGRKRGYAKKTGFDNSSYSGVPSIVEIRKTIQMNSAEKVYSGPSSTYAGIGSVDKDEYAILIEYGTRGWYHIEYSTPSGNKQGYVPKTTATTTDLPKYADINYRTYTFAEQHTMDGYTSGLGRDLKYYTIGDENSDNVLFLNFAIHGHEDHQSGDGMALVEMAFRTLATLDNHYHEILANNWYIVVVPTFNPDGVLVNDDCVGKCNGVGRHNAVQMIRDEDGKWIKFTDTADGANALGHIDMNRCFPYNANGGFAKLDSTSTVSDRRNYTGPSAMMAQEAQALSDLINKYKNKSGTKYFIDIHGWTQQIIVSEDNSTIGNAFLKCFNTKETPYYIEVTLRTGGANGYVAKYAYALGYQSCLFEFPHNTKTDFYNDTYGECFISAISSLLNIKEG